LLITSLAVYVSSQVVFVHTWYRGFTTVYVGVSSGCYLLPLSRVTYEGWNFNSGNYLFTTDTK